ncbi:uncharacterized protein LOC144129880 [Amblyomma americanum]
MKPVSVLLLAVCALAVEAQNLTGRTFGFAHSHHDHNHGAVHDSHSLNFQAHGHHHVPPPHNSHGSHANQVHAHNHHQGHGHVLPGQQHPSSHGHEHQHHPHQPSASSGAVVPVAGNVDMVPVMVCNVVHVPAAHAVAPGPSHSGSLVPNSVLNKIPTSIGNVAGKVVSPLISLLHNASVWLNRTAHSNHAHNVPHQPHPAASPTHVVHEILALKKHPHQPVPPRTVAPTKAPRPAVTATSPTPTAAAATPSIRATTVSVPVQVQTGTVGVPAPALGATVPRFLTSTAVPASSADTAAFPEGGGWSRSSKAQPASPQQTYAAEAEGFCQDSVDEYQRTGSPDTEGSSPFPEASARSLTLKANPTNQTPGEYPARRRAFPNSC